MDISGALARKFFRGKDATRGSGLTTRSKDATVARG